MGRVKAVQRIAITLVTSIAIAYVSNTGTLGFLSWARFWLFEILILLTGLTATWKAGILPRIQARSWVALAETVLVVIVFATYLSFNGTVCQLPTLCISTDTTGGVVVLPTFLYLAGANLFVGLTEEILFRGYLIRELDMNMGIRRQQGRFFKSPIQAIFISALIFALFHIPRYGTFDSGISLLSDLGWPLLGGLMLGLAYAMTNWNLAVPVFCHFSYDAFGFVGILNPAFPGLKASFVSLVILPLLAVAFHRVIKRIPGGTSIAFT